MQINRYLILLKSLYNYIFLSKVQVSMRVSAELLEFIDTLTNGDEDEKPEGVTWEHTDTNGERRLRFRDELTVRFNNGTTQVKEISKIRRKTKTKISREKRENRGRKTGRSDFGTHGYQWEKRAAL